MSRNDTVRPAPLPLEEGTRRLRARWRLSADDDLVEVIHAEQRQVIVEQSGLACARPDAEIRFSRPAGYLELLGNVQIHGYHLMLTAGRALSRGEIAGDWYDRVYLPAVAALPRERLERACPGATVSDLFLTLFSGAVTRSRTRLPGPRRRRPRVAR